MNSSYLPSPGEVVMQDTLIAPVTLQHPSGDSSGKVSAQHSLVASASSDAVRKTTISVNSHISFHKGPLGVCRQLKAWPFTSSYKSKGSISFLRALKKVDTFIAETPRKAGFK